MPIPFGRLLKVVAVVDPANVQTQELLAQIRADGFEVEIVSHFERDVVEDVKQILGAAGQSAGELQNLSVSALIGKVMSDGTESQKQALQQLAQSFKK